MHDKKRQSDEGSSASEQANVDRADVSYVKRESSSSINAQVQEPSGSGLPPGYNRQGYCSCCHVHYINLEKHLAGDQHKQISNLHRNRFSTSMLMERFLQDVHLYHPQNYHDIRPTYDEMPEVNALSSSHEDNSCTLLHEPQATVSRKTLFDCVSDSDKSKFKSRNKTLTQSCNTNPEENQGSKNEDHQQSVFLFNSSLATCHEALSKTINTIPQTFNYSTLPLYSTSKVAANHTCFETPHSVLCSGSNKNLETKYGKCKPCLRTDTESPKKTLQNINLQGSCCHLPSGTTSKNSRILKSQEDKQLIFKNHILPSDSNKVKDEEFVGKTLFKNKRIHVSKNGNSVDEIIEAVIKRYCPKALPERMPEGDEDSIFSLNVPSVAGCTEDSCLSFEWNIPLELKDNPSKVMMTNLDLHKEYNVNIDEEYTSKLKFALSASPTKEIEVVKFENKQEVVKSEYEQEVLPALPHIPPSFVGKTWSQVMFEDDLKIEALVKEFRKGKFHCYFEDECSMNMDTKRKHKSKQIEKNVEAKTEDLDESRKLNLLPLFEDDFCEEHQPDTCSIKSEQIVKPKITKPCRRVWRQASRCQVVKVSHGTQTSLVNYPVVKKKIPSSESQQGIFDTFWEEKTPEMKTRMCALKLPESYTKILNPMQPKTMIYVLSHPDLKLSTTGIRSRNRCSTDSRDSVYFKYKQSPLKYYDPLTNRILKTPPRNSIRGKSSKALCVRKLFRSLSSDGNVDKIDSEQKESNTSKKSLSSCSNDSLNIEAVKGKDFNFSKKGSRSSLSSEYMGSSYEKAIQHEKPYTQISISPHKAASSKVKDDAQHSIPIPKSKSKPPRLQNNIIKEYSARHTKLVESRIATRSKDNSHRIVKGLEKQTKQKSGSRKQPRRKSSVLPKSKKQFVQAYQPSKKKVIRQSNEQSVEDHKKRLVKAIKPSKRKQSLTKNHFQNKYQEKNTNSRSPSKSSQLFVQNTMHYLRSRHKVTNTSSTARTFTNTLTRRNVR